MFHPGIGYHAYVYKGMKRSNCTSERKTPTDGLDVRSQVWVCRDHSEGRHNLFGKRYESQTGVDTRTGWVAYFWIPLRLIVVETERAIQSGKRASEEGLANLRDGSKVRKREIGKYDLQDVKVEAFGRDHRIRPSPWNNFKKELNNEPRRVQFSRSDLTRPGPPSPRL